MMLGGVLFRSALLERDLTKGIVMDIEQRRAWTAPELKQQGAAATEQNEGTPSDGLSPALGVQVSP